MFHCTVGSQNHHTQTKTCLTCWEDSCGFEMGIMSLTHINCLLQNELHFCPYISTFIPSFQAEMEICTSQMAVFSQMYFCWVISNPDQVLCGKFFGQAQGFFVFKLGITRRYFLPLKYAKS